MALPQDIRPVNNELADSITRSAEAEVSTSYSLCTDQRATTSNGSSAKTLRAMWTT